MQHLDYAHAIGLIEHFVDGGELFLTIRGRKYTPEFKFTVGNNEITQKAFRLRSMLDLKEKIQLC